jgi:hypothetical protein
MADNESAEWQCRPVAMHAAVAATDSRGSKIACVFAYCPAVGPDGSLVGSAVRSGVGGRL